MKVYRCQITNHLGYEVLGTEGPQIAGFFEEEFEVCNYEAVIDYPELLLTTTPGQRSWEHIGEVIDGEFVPCVKH